MLISTSIIITLHACMYCLFGYQGPDIFKSYGYYKEEAEW